MIPMECIYGLIGAVATVLAGRFGIPLFSTSSGRTRTSTSLADTVRQHLLDILKGLSQPPPDPDAELRKQMAALAEKKSG